MFFYVFRYPACPGGEGSFGYALCDQASDNHLTPTAHRSDTLSVSFCGDKIMVTEDFPLDMSLYGACVFVD